MHQGITVTVHYTLIYYFNYYCHTESPFQLTTSNSPTTGTNNFTGATSELTVTIVVATVTAGCSLVLLSVITCLLFVYRLSRKKTKAKYNGDGDIQLVNDNDVVPKIDTPTTELRAIVTYEPVYDNITDVM